MKKWDYVVTVFIGVAILLSVFLALDFIISFLNTTTVIEEGTITSVVPFFTASHNIKYVNVTFDNGHSYNIKLLSTESGNPTIDFTVHSKIIIEMHNPAYPWFPTDDNHFWFINKFIKVP